MQDCYWALSLLENRASLFTSENGNDLMGPFSKRFQKWLPKKVGRTDQLVSNTAKVKDVISEIRL